MLSFHSDNKYFITGIHFAFQNCDFICAETIKFIDISLGTDIKRIEFTDMCVYFCDDTTYSILMAFGFNKRGLVLNKNIKLQQLVNEVRRFYARNKNKHNNTPVFERPKLSQNEAKILKCIIKGFTVSSCAVIFDIDYKTVSTHKYNTYSKLGVYSNRKNAVISSLISSLMF